MADLQDEIKKLEEERAKRIEAERKQQQADADDMAEQTKKLRKQH